jgi:MFS family permease
MTSKTAKKTSTRLNYEWVILAVVYLASVAAPLNLSKVPPLIPILLERFQVDLTQAGLFMSIPAGIGLLLALPAGIAFQKFGAKTTLLISLGLMSAGSITGALSKTYAVLMASRVLEGFGVGLISVAAPATIAMWFPPERQGIPMGIFATWRPVGTVTIYNVAPILVASFGWQSAWWVGAGFALIMMGFVGWLITPHPDDPQAEPMSQEKPGHGQALANRNIWLLAVAFTCFNLVLITMGTYYPTFLNLERGYEIGQAAFISSIMTFIIIFSAPAAGWLSDRTGSRRLVLALPFLALAVLFIFPYQVMGWQIILFLVVLGLIGGAIPTAVFAAAPEVMVKPQWAGLGLAVVLMGQNVGQLVGPVLFGEFVQRFDWITAGYLMIPVCLVGFLCAWVVRIK